MLRGRKPKLHQRQRIERGDLMDRHREKFGFRPAVIEDCAHAWGSTYKGRHIGTHGNLCAFSFQAIKGTML
jgi:dTDP-4-amino-4,6-dideoxygalactose transaminase